MPTKRKKTKKPNPAMLYTKIEKELERFTKLEREFESAMKTRGILMDKVKRILMEEAKRAMLGKAKAKRRPATGP